jgi:hypothetical protein
MPGATCPRRIRNEAARREPRVTPSLAAVYDELLDRASQPSREAQSRDAREAFLRRTSSSARAQPSAPEDRVRAAWDDALTQGSLAALLAPTFEDASERALVRAISRAHRSTFAISTEDDHHLVRDIIGGGEFVVLQRDDVVRGLLAVQTDEPAPLFEARVVAGADGCALLPGVLFHPVAATPLIHTIVQAPEAQRLSRHAVCDALLRMLHVWSSLSRVKIAYAYRLDALPQRSPATDGRADENPLG